MNFTFYTIKVPDADGEPKTLLAVTPDHRKVIERALPLFQVPEPIAGDIGNFLFTVAELEDQQTFDSPKQANRFGGLCLWMILMRSDNIRCHQLAAPFTHSLLQRFDGANLVEHLLRFDLSAHIITERLMIQPDVKHDFWQVFQ